MTKRVSYSALAMNAMKKAAEEAVERAAAKNLKIPVWENGKIIHLDAKVMQSRNS